MSPVDLFETDIDLQHGTFPLSEHAQIWDVVLNAGECIYIPAFWWIQSKTDSREFPEDGEELANPLFEEEGEEPEHEGDEELDMPNPADFEELPHEDEHPPEEEIHEGDHKDSKHETNKNDTSFKDKITTTKKDEKDENKEENKEEKKEDKLKDTTHNGPFRRQLKESDNDDYYHDAPSWKEGTTILVK